MDVEPELLRLKRLVIRLSEDNAKLRTDNEDLLYINNLLRKELEEQRLFYAPVILTEESA